LRGLFRGDFFKPESFSFSIAFEEVIVRHDEGEPMGAGGLFEMGSINGPLRVELDFSQYDSVEFSQAVVRVVDSVGNVFPIDDAHIPAEIPLYILVNHSFTYPSSYHLEIKISAAKSVEHLLVERTIDSSVESAFVPVLQNNIVLSQNLG
jgi:hypothetical protein